MEHIKAIYFQRYVYQFENYFKDPLPQRESSKDTDHRCREKKFESRNINDLNGFICCICCVIPFATVKACIMCLLYLTITIPTTSIILLLLFPYQLIMVYIASLSTVLLGPKIKWILAFTLWFLYTLFITVYLIIANLCCIYFSFYAAFKTTLCSDYNLFGGYLDGFRVVIGNLNIFWLNNTREFHVYCLSIRYYRLDEALNDYQWDISYISLCSQLTAFFNIILSILLIMTGVLVEIVIYFIPFTLHILCNLYCIKFGRYYIGKCVPKQPCLALIGLPFIIIFLLIIPLFVAVYLVLFVWLYSAFWNKAILIEKYTDSPFDCLQHWSYILNTINLYNYTLASSSFQSCWKCHCLTDYRSERAVDDYEGFDFDVKSLSDINEFDVESLRQKTKQKNGGKGDGDEGNPYEVTLKYISFYVFDTTKKNKELVTMGKATEKPNVNQPVNQPKPRKNKRSVPKEKQQKIQRKSKLKSTDKQKKRKKRSRIPSESSTSQPVKDKRHKPRLYSTVATEESVDEMHEHMTMLNGGFPGLSVDHSSEDSEEEEGIGFSYPRGL